MRSTFFAILCATLLVLSLGLRPPAPDAEKTLKQINDKLEIALLSNNSTNTRIAIGEAIEMLGKVALNSLPCGYSVKQLMEIFKQFSIEQDKFTSHDVVGWLLNFYVVETVNRACFPIVNLARSLIVGGAQALGLNTSSIPEWKNNKIISFDLPNTFAGKAILVVEDVVRFVECFATAGLVVLANEYDAIRRTEDHDDEYRSYDDYDPTSIRRLNLFAGTLLIGTCGDAINLAYDIFAKSEKETKALAQVEKISTALFAEDKTEVELLAFNKTVNTALNTLISLGYADLCLNELTTTLYQYFMAEYITPGSMVPYTFLTQMALSMPYSANQDCLAYTNFVKYAFVEAGNLIFGSNNTYTPREGGIIKLEDFGFSDDSYIKKGLSGISTGLDTLRCVTASVATLPFVADIFSNVRHDQWSGALSTFESAVLQALSGSASCTTIYSQFKQKYGTF